MNFSSTASAGLVRSNVTVSGPAAARQTMVFLHGLGADQSTWDLLAPYFETEYRVVKLDLVGTGQPAAAAYDYARYSSLAAHADDLLDVLHELDLHAVIFVGHSVSSLIGVLAAIKEPARFGQLVLFSPSPRFLNDMGYHGGFARQDISELLAAMEQNYTGGVQALSSLMLGPAYPELTLDLTNSFLRTSPGIVQQLARVAFYCDHRADLPLLTTPTLVLQCAHDVIAPLAVGMYLQEQLPDSQLVVIDTPGHCAHLTAPGYSHRAIEKFLQETLA